jgi:hypothetical protein
MKKNLFNEWVLDASFTDDTIATFVPYKDGDFIIGMNYMSNKCPGKLVAVIHVNGQDACDQWIEEHPDWYNKYKNDEEE